MLKTEKRHVPEAPHAPTLADLSRSASVISTSSSDSSRSILQTPRPRPIRTFTSPRTASPHSRSPRNSRPPSYLARELGLQNDTAPKSPVKARSKSRGRNVTIDDFNTSGTLGEGSYSTVIKATHKANGKTFAIKILDKSYLQRKQKQSVALVEKNALLRLSEGHPGVVRLHYAFQDEWNLYFVLDLAEKGEMQSLLSRQGSLNTACARYYTAQLVDAVDFMHKKGVIHRDLKPENLLLDKNFRIKITDFGTAKISESDTVTEKFVGTAQYVAPELVEANESSKSSDLWAIGCVLYQMIAGRFAFQGLSEFLTLQKVKQMDYSFPEGFDKDAKDLVEKLLVRNPTQRLGAGDPGTPSDMLALRAHLFFAALDWTTLWTSDPPPVGPGLLKKEHPLAQSSDRNWEDIGVAWDKLVQREEPSDDELDWAPDARAPQVIVQRHDSNLPKGVEIGPFDELRSTSAPVNITIVPQEQAEGSPSTGSPGSLNGLNDGMKAMRPFSPERPNLPVSDPTESERGRNHAPTPVQGYGPNGCLPTSMSLADGETILFDSSVEARSLRRRASKLLPLPVSPIKPKIRNLVLTDQRLICLKYKDKGLSDGVLKLELFLHIENRKDARAVITAVELKGEREFVILTASKSYSFAAHDNKLATTWVERIDAALNKRRSLARDAADADRTLS